MDKRDIQDVFPKGRQVLVPSSGTYGIVVKHVYNWRMQPWGIKVKFADGRTRDVAYNEVVPVGGESTGE